MNSDKVYIEFILERVSRIDKIVELGRPVIDDTVLAQDALLYNILVLGRAANDLSASFKKSCKAVKWRTLLDFREKLEHVDMEIDFDAIWQFIDHDLPTLKRCMREALAKLE